MQAEPDLATLRMLSLVAERGSISAAAKELDLSQQAVSLRLRGLESELGIRLLARSPKGSHLTSDGELVVGWARPVLEAADRLDQSVASLKDPDAKTLRIAASLTIAEHLVPEWIALWGKRVGTNGPVPRLTAANSRSVIGAVMQGAADLGFIETPSIPKSLSSTKIGSDVVEVVVSPNHRWARPRTVSPTDFVKTPLVLREMGSGTRQALEDALESSGLQTLTEPAHVASTMLEVRSSIMANVAPGALSSLAVMADVESGRLVRVTIEGIEIRRPLTAIWAKGSSTKDVRDFLSIVKSAKLAR